MYQTLDTTLIKANLPESTKKEIDAFNAQAGKIAFESGMECTVLGSKTCKGQEKLVIVSPTTGLIGEFIHDFKSFK